MAPRDDPFVADLLKVADTRIAELEQQLGLTKDRNLAVEGKVATFTRQVWLSHSVAYLNESIYGRLCSVSSKWSSWRYGL